MSKNVTEMMVRRMKAFDVSDFKDFFHELNDRNKIKDIGRAALEYLMNVENVDLVEEYNDEEEPELEAQESESEWDEWKQIDDAQRGRDLNSRESFT